MDGCNTVVLKVYGRDVKQIEYEIDREPRQSFPSTKPRPTYRVSPAETKKLPPESDLVTLCNFLKRVAKS